MKEIMERMREAAGLPPETDDRALLEGAMEKLKLFDELRAGMESLKGTLGLDVSAGMEEVGLAVSSLSAPPPSGSADELESLRGEVAALRERELKEKIERAVAEGKIFPAQRDWALGYATSDPEGFENYLATGPVAVHMGEMVRHPSGGGARPDPLQERLNALLGIPAEVFARYNTTS